MDRSSRRWRGLPLIVAAIAALAAVAVGCSSSPSSTPVKLSAAGKQGQMVAGEHGCVACHTPDGSRSTGPTWKGLYGSTVKLADGSEAKVDDAYLQQAITDPRSQVVAGYANIMPRYPQLTPADIKSLIAYLHDLGDTPSSSSGS